MEKNSKNIFYIFLLIIFLNSIYNISLNFDSLGFESLSNIIFFLPLSLILFIPYIKNLSGRNSFIQENVEKELDIIEKLTDVSKNNYKVISNFYLKNGNEKTQFDIILIFENKINNIILCNRNTSISIEPNMSNDMFLSENREINKKLKNTNLALKNTFGDIEIENNILFLDELKNESFSNNKEISIYTIDEFINYIKGFKERGMDNINLILNKIYENINYINNPFHIREKYDIYGVKNNFIRVKILISLFFVFLYLYNK
ncbi:hypothetical protein [Clostridium sp.]|uniref:hypothetical protein n=1 Tax=Clostridium sp. TaxID=1506 RepID=UPI003F2F0F81